MGDRDLMLIESMMNRDVVVIRSQDPVVEAARAMRDHGLGALVVIEKGKMVGLFSERDLMNRVVAEGKDPATVPVGEVCTHNPVTAKSTASVQDCYRLLKEHRFRHLPICGEDGEPVGIVSSRDFLRSLMVEVETEAEISLDATCVKLGQLTELMSRIQAHR
jgi:CBS domain-containing protein